MKGRLSPWIGSLWIAGLVVAVLGRPAPYGNELVYMPLLKTAAVPEYLTIDWTFGSGFAEKGVFNLIFSLPMRLFDIEALAWLGRISFWIITARLVIALGARLGAAVWTTVIATMTLVGIGWSMGVGAATLFVHFEASLVAVPLFLLAAISALDRKVLLAALYVGLTFSFHPVIGLWMGGSILIALLAIPETRRKMFSAVPVAALGALPGLYFLLVGGVPTQDPSAVEFVVLARIPHHVDPFAFGERGPLLLSLMLVFNLVWSWRSRAEYRFQVLGIVQLLVTSLALLGLASRLAGYFGFLLLQPFRPIATIVPLVFALTLAAILGKPRTAIAPLWAHTQGRALVILGGVVVVGVLLMWNPVVGLSRNVIETVEAWSAEPTDIDEALEWVRENTPDNTVLVSPPWVENSFYLSERAQFVNWEAVTYDRTAEWQERLRWTTDSMSPWLDRHRTGQDLLERYESLDLEHWMEVSRIYGVTHVLTPADLSITPVFSSGEWHLYVLGA